METQERRFALLVDADNVSVQYVRLILNELANMGTVLCKRIYGDWTTQRLAPWKNVLLRHAIQPIQQYGYTSGKNATDSAMIIDAMDLLYSKNYNAFCLASSDSDFTRLAVRLREGGMFVVGMGEQKTPKAFCGACDLFKYLDLLKENTHEKPPIPKVVPPPSEPKAAQVKIAQPVPVKPTAKVASVSPEPKTAQVKVAQPASSESKVSQTKAVPSVPAKSTAKATQPVPAKPVANVTVNFDLRIIRGIIHAILNENSDDDGWLPLPRLKELIIKRRPDFDSRNFGKAKFSAFLSELGTLELRKTSAGHIDATRRKTTTDRTDTHAS